MEKSKTFGALNAFIALLIFPPVFLLWGLLTQQPLSETIGQFPNLLEFMIMFAIIISMSSIFLANAWLTYKHLARSKPPSMIGMVIFHLGLWLALFFWSIFNVFPAVSLGLVLSSITIFLIFKRSLKLAPFLVITLIVSGLAMFYFYAEQYCWRLGDKAQSLSKEITVPTTDEEKKQGYGEKIGVGWRTQRDCRNDFNAFEAIKNDLLHFPNGIPSKDDFVSFLKQIPNQPN